MFRLLEYMGKFPIKINEKNRKTFTDGKVLVCLF